MDTILTMRTFCAVVSEGSFVAGARKLSISPALASKYVAQLEERLSARLLNRTTRSISLTGEGRSYYDRAQQLLAEFDSLETSVQHLSDNPRGKLTIAAPVLLGEDFLTSALADFLTLYPEIEIEARLADRYVNLIDEGFDLAIRIGKLEDSSLIARRLAVIQPQICASPDYIDRFGAPTHPRDLADHICIIDSNYRGGSTWEIETPDGAEKINVKGRYITNNTASCRKMALKGLGIANTPGFVVEQDIRAGRLVKLLQDYPRSRIGLYALYPHSRHLAHKVRICVDHLARYFANSEAFQLQPH